MIPMAMEMNLKMEKSSSCQILRHSYNWIRRKTELPLSLIIFSVRQGTGYSNSFRGRTKGKMREDERSFYLDIVSIGIGKRIGF
jgi:hypothetical protein